MLDIFPVDGPWPGRMALCARPRAGSWLEDDIRTLKTNGYTVLISALTPNEIARLGLQELPYACHVNGVRSVQFPIGNLLVPERERALEALREWKASLDGGEGLALHCWATVGRSPTLAAALLVLSGVDAETAWERLTIARGREVPDTHEQRAWVSTLLSNLPAELGPE